MKTNLFALLSVVCAASCTPVLLTPILTRPPVGANRDSAVVLKSDDNPLFDPLVESFLSRFDGTASIYSNISTASGKNATNTLRRAAPSMVVCLGNDAAKYVKENIHDIPVIFALVPAAQELGLATLPNFMGVSVAPLPEMEFSQFMMVLPHMRRVLTFYDPVDSQIAVDQTLHSLAGLGIELVAISVKSPDDIKRRFVDVSRNVDAVWLLADPVAVNDETFQFLRKATLAKNLPLLTSLSEHFSEAGALMSVSVDIASVGSQVALLTHKVLHQGKLTGQIGVQPPLGVSLAINLDTASHIGVQVDPQILGIINRVYTSTAER